MMENTYRCPYCGKAEYNIGSRKSGPFTSWIAIRNHTPSCTKNNGEYAITEQYGPIYYKEFMVSLEELKYKYPDIIHKTHLRNFKNKGIIPRTFKHNNVYSKEELLANITRFYNKEGKIPQLRDFSYNSNYVSYKTIQNHFGSWNAGIEAAGYEPNIQNGFGIDTFGLDSHLYRSRAEAYFADNFLYKHYNYEIESAYPKPYGKWRYDWNIPELDLFIELDGGIRPKRTIEKIELNKKLNRNCLVIPTDIIYIKNKLQDFIKDDR